MADKTLATFRIEPEKWEKFKTLASSIDSTASAVLLQFIDSCLDANQISVPNTPIVALEELHKVIDNRLDIALNQVVDEQSVLRRLIDNRLELTLRQVMTEYSDSQKLTLNRLELALREVKEQQEELRGKLKTR